MKSMGLGAQFVSGLDACREVGKVTVILPGEILEGFLAKGCQKGDILWPLLWSLDVNEPNKRKIPNQGFFMRLWVRHTRCDRTGLSIYPQIFNYEEGLKGPK